MLTVALHCSPYGTTLDKAKGHHDAEDSAPIASCVEKDCQISRMEAVWFWKV